MKGVYFLIGIVSFNLGWGWWDEDWMYRKKVVIDNSGNANDLINYQIDFILTSSNFDYSHAKSGGEDLRFVKFSDNSEDTLFFYIEQWKGGTNNDTSIIWVKVDTIHASSIDTIYMYYGNTSAGSSSNPDSTFEFWDDFEDYSLGDLVGQGPWVAFGSHPSAHVIDTDTYEGNRGVEAADNYRAADGMLSDTIGGDWRIGCYGKFVNGGGGGTCETWLLRGGISSSYVAYCELGQHNSWSPSGEWTVNPGPVWQTGRQNSGVSFSTGVWYRCEIKKVEGGNVDFVANFSTITSLSEDAGALEWVSFYADEGRVGRMDNFWAAKYTDPHPSVTIMSEEEFCDCIVTTTNDSGEGSLRSCIDSANTWPGFDRIGFNIPTSDANYNSSQGTWTITPTSSLPQITDDAGVHIYGESQPDSNPNGPEIIINASSLSGGHIFHINYSYHNTISGLTLQGNSSVNGIYFYYGDTNTVKNCYIGTNYDATSASPLNYGIYINVGRKNVIGDTLSGWRNIISGNTNHGVYIEHPNSENNKIVGNYIGVTREGTSSLSNGGDGVHVNAADSTLISNNIISGNSGDGIEVNLPEVNRTVIEENYIGVNKDGTSAISNGEDGIHVHAADSTLISNNIISGNASCGIRLYHGDADSTIIMGNYIGTNASGDAAIPNGSHGIYIYNSRKTVIGGKTSGAGNLISGNNGCGIYLEYASPLRTYIFGNYIGVDKDGTSAIANGSHGIQIHHSYSNIIGDTVAFGRNVISGNTGHGIYLETIYADNNQILGNYIGVDKNGTSGISNGGAGVYIYGAESNTIKKNTIAYNTNDGVVVEATWADYNLISQNSIFGNSLGIDIGTNGSGHGNQGANEDCDPPTITSVEAINKGNYEVQGTAGANYVVEIFIAQDGEGKTYLGTTTADASGNWIDTVTASGGDTLVATSTTLNNSTSEFSAPAPLAIRCYSFSAKSENARVYLSWYSVIENDIKEFIIERDDKQIAMIKPKGVATKYSYVDSNVIIGEIYSYRLGEVDIYGNINWHGPIKVRVRGLKEYKFALFPSIPMPFRNSTVIAYSVPGRKEERNVRLEICDISGRIIKILVNKRKAPGHYKVIWDGKDEGGEEVGRGIYFCRLKIGRFTKIRKIIIL